jgi:hypothetical protein
MDNLIGRLVADTGVDRPAAGKAVAIFALLPQQRGHRGTIQLARSLVQSPSSATSSDA